MKMVAPNSPSEIANANPAATSAARATIGRSTSRQHAPGCAPSVAAASRSRGSMERSTGVIDAHDERDRDERLRDRDQPRRAVRRSSGGSSSAMRNPKPTVTADTPSGSDSDARRDRGDALRGERERAAAHRRRPRSPWRSAANRSEFAIASVGGTNRVLPTWTSPSAR